MDIFTDMTHRLQSYLDLSNAELKVTAGNMANVDTPGYQTLGFDFSAEMDQALRNGPGLTGRTDSPAAPRLIEVDGLIARPDGNDVSLDREGLKMAEAQLKFRTGVELMKRELNRLSDAIHADGK